MASRDLSRSERRIKKRYSIKIKAKAILKLFGDSNIYALETVNLSESGLLLEFDQPVHHLNKSSILEITLLLENNAEAPGFGNISFLAKFVRNASDTEIGVKIIDIDCSNSSIYQKFIKSFSTAEVPWEGE